MEGASEGSIRPAPLLKDMKSRVDLMAGEWFSNNEDLSIFTIPTPTWWLKASVTPVSRSENTPNPPGHQVYLLPHSYMKGINPTPRINL